MRGLLFTELFEMVDAHHPPELLERVIDAAHLPNGGAYTAVGNYPAAEMTRLVECLGHQTGQPLPGLLQGFGHHLYGRFLADHAEFFDPAHDALELLESVDQYIHVEVRKLYPEAELPVFLCHRPTPDSLVMLYRSPRALADVAEGLIRSCIAHYGRPYSVEREDLSGGAGTEVRFTLRPTMAATSSGQPLSP
jgi:hypothetical protein